MIGRDDCGAVTLWSVPLRGAQRRGSRGCVVVDGVGLLVAARSALRVFLGSLRPSPRSGNSQRHEPPPRCAPHEERVCRRCLVSGGAEVWVRTGRVSLVTPIQSVVAVGLTSSVSLVDVDRSAARALAYRPTLTPGRHARGRYSLGRAELLRTKRSRRAGSRFGRTTPGLKLAKATRRPTTTMCCGCLTIRGRRRRQNDVNVPRDSQREPEAPTLRSETSQPNPRRNRRKDLARSRRLGRFRRPADKSYSAPIVRADPVLAQYQSRRSTLHQSSATLRSETAQPTRSAKDAKTWRGASGRAGPDDQQTKVTASHS